MAGKASISPLISKVLNGLNCMNEGNTFWAALSILFSFLDVLHTCPVIYSFTPLTLSVVVVLTPSNYLSLFAALNSLRNPFIESVRISGIAFLNL
jgi:hypothetical protein